MNASPLLNKKILLTRPEQQSKKIAEKLIERGAIPIIIPLIEIRPIEEWGEVDNSIYDIEQYDYLIFTSANAVFYFMQRANFLQVEIKNIKIVVVGNATKKRLEDFDLKVDIVPEKFYSKEIINALGNDIKGKKILFPCANIAREELKKSLHEVGAYLYKVIVYNTIFKKLINNELRKINSKNLDAIMLYSPSAARALCEVLNPENYKYVNLVCIGRTTSESVEKKGFASVLIAGSQTEKGILEVLENNFLCKND